jgi:hypothetical protein
MTEKLTPSMRPIPLLERVNLPAATTQQQPPQQGSKAILPLVLQDLEARAQMGLSKYGKLLEANNGRNALWDAYQEVLDLAMYLRQLIEEEKGDQR